MGILDYKLIEGSYKLISISINDAYFIGFGMSGNL